MLNKNMEAKQVAAVRKILSEVPAASSYSPVTEAVDRATTLGEEKIAAALTNVSSMPQSTNVFANPVLHKAAVNCR